MAAFACLLESLLRDLRVFGVASAFEVVIACTSLSTCSGQRRYLRCYNIIVAMSAGKKIPRKSRGKCSAGKSTTAEVWLGQQQGEFWRGMGDLNPRPPA